MKPIRRLVSTTILALAAMLCAVTAFAGTEEWECPECGETVTGNFCSNCGAKKTEWECPECGEMNTGNFCSNCGTKNPFGSDYLSIGDYITFGSYEQDNDTSNGSEPIEWLVLDKEDSKVLIISRYGLEVRTYHEEDIDITWETCDLRNWLNETFYEEAFSSEEQMEMVETVVEAEDNEEWGTGAGNDTTDKIFLLSIAEAEELFKDDEARKCYPTEYVKAQGVYINEDTGTSAWWLRSPGSLTYSAAFVISDGSVIYDGYYVDDSYSVRPALWINQDS